MKRLSKFTILIALVPMLSACNLTQEPPVSKVNYAPGVIALRIGDIQMVDNSALKPNALTEESVDAKQAIFGLVREKLRAAGNNGVLKVTVEEVSFSKTPLAQEESSIASLESEKLRMVGKYRVKFNLISGTYGNSVNINTEIKAHSSKTIEGYYRDADKTRLLNEIHNELMQKLDQQLEVQIHKAFGAYIVK